MYWLLILTLKSILSSVIGSSFYTWFQDTKFGIWFQKKVEQFLEHVAQKYDLELSKTDSKFKKQFPLQAARLEELEKIAHPPCGLDGFDGYQPLVDRIESLEEDLMLIFEMDARRIGQYINKKK